MFCFFVFATKFHENANTKKKFSCKNKLFSNEKRTKFLSVAEEE